MPATRHSRSKKWAAAATHCCSTAQLVERRSDRSSSNEFSNVVDGINLTVNDACFRNGDGERRVDELGLVSNVKEFVAAYNSLRTNLDAVTSFDAENLTTGILFGTSAALRVDSELTHVVTSRFFGFGSFQSLESVGISLDDKGKMTLDESKLKAAFDKDPESIKKMFTDENRGVAKKLNDAIEQLAGKNNSVLTVAQHCADRTSLNRTKSGLRRWTKS